MNSRVRRWLVVIPTSLATACGGRACGGERTSSQTSSAVSSGTSTRAGTASADELKAVLQGLEMLAAGIPRETFDVTFVARAVGSDPAAVLSWVRDNTSWVPYRGALRGSRGVLMDRAGNSLDRAQLVADMLRQSGRTVRLAHATLPEARAREVASGSRSSVPQLQSDQHGGSVVADEELARIARAFQVDVDNLRTTRSENATRESQMLTTFAGQLEAQLNMLVDTTNGATSPSDERSAVMGAASDHWWVQYLEGGHWIDLDAGLPRGQDDPALEADRTVPVEQREGQIHVPDEYAHRVTIRIIVEQLTGTSLQRKVALEHSFRPAEVMDQPIVVQHLPLNWSAPAAFVQAGDPIGALRDATLQQKEWLPIITIGERMVRRASFTDRGDLNEQPGNKRLGNAVGSGFSGGFDALGGGEEPSQEGQLAAEWIEYEIHVPGERSRLITRDLFDLRKSAFSTEDRSRRAVSLLGRVEILPVVSRLSRAYAQARKAESLLRSRDTLTSVLARASAGDLAGMLDSGARLLPSGDALLSLALARFDWSWAGSDVYVNAPNILTYRRQPVDVTSGALRVREGFDIVSNGVGVRPTSRLLPFYARLLQGITDTNAEALVIGEASVGNAGVLLGPHPDPGRWVLLRSAREVASADLNWSGAFRQRVVASLESGDIVIAPRRTEGQAESSFWAVNPASGDTVGIGHLGWGQATVEYLLVAGMVGIAAFLSVCAVVTARAQRLGTNGSLFLSCLGVFVAGPGVWADQWADATGPLRLPPPAVTQPPYSRLCGAKLLCR